MNFDLLEKHCLGKKGAVKDVKEDWGAILYKVGNKMFALLGIEKNTVKEVEMLSVKLDPTVSDILRATHENIKPGYHLNKTHWSSFYPCTENKEELIKEMIDMSYELVFNSLTKKLQKDILDS